MRLARSEAFKLRTTRTFYGVVGGALALVLVISIAAAAAAPYKHGDEPVRDLIGAASLAQLFALVLGVLAVSTEFRHGTITPTLLAVPDRGRLVLAKAIAYTVAGLALGVVAFAASAALVAAITSARGVGMTSPTGDVVRWVIGGALGAALYAALGVGLGALMRNQVGAIVGALAWIFVVESLLGIIPGVGHALEKFGIGGLAAGLTGTAHGADASHRLGQVPAGVLLAAYAAILIAAGIAVMRRRDVTGG